MFYIKILSLNAVLHQSLVLTQSVHGISKTVQNVVKLTFEALSFFLHTYTVWTCTYHVEQHQCYIHTIRDLTPSKMFVNGWKWDQTASSWVLMSEEKKCNSIVHVYSHFEIGVIVTQFIKDLHCKTGIICDNYLFSSAHFEKVYIFTIAQLIFIPIAFSYI